MLSIFKSRVLAFAPLCIYFGCQSAVLAQSAGPAGGGAAAPVVSRPDPISPAVLPTDLTPIGIGQERNLFSPGLGYWLSQKLPARLWFNTSVETSQRLETNVFSSYRKPVGDYVFRTIPNVSVGYNVFKHTSVYSNYFVIKDVYANHPHFTGPTTQSVSIGVRHDIPIGQRSNLQLDFQARELWQVRHLHQADFLPSATFTHAFTPNFIAFANVVLQMRGKHYFQGPSREMDPFYTIGCLYRRGKWTFSATDTLVTNFRYHDAIPRQSNVSMIADLEADYPVSSKIPGLISFIRAEPIFNYNQQKLSGLSGFDFRLFGGLRYSANKPSFGQEIGRMREFIQDSDQPRRTSERLHSLLASISACQSDFESRIGRVGWLPQFSDNEILPPVTLSEADSTTSQVFSETEEEPVNSKPRVNSAGMLPHWN